jgi:hypothetical protein
VVETESQYYNRIEDTGGATKALNVGVTFQVSKMKSGSSTWEVLVNLNFMPHIMRMEHFVNLMVSGAYVVGTYIIVQFIAEWRGRQGNRSRRMEATTVRHSSGLLGSTPGWSALLTTRCSFSPLQKWYMVRWGPLLTMPTRPGSTFHLRDRTFLSMYTM